MAQIIKGPNLYNMAYAPNVYTMNQLGTADRYALRVIIDGTIVATFLQPANPTGFAHIDVSKVLQSYLKPIAQYESFGNTVIAQETQYARDTEGIHLTYSVEYGSQTGNGAINWTPYATRYVINGYANWRDVNYDFTGVTGGNNVQPFPSDNTCPNSNINAQYFDINSYLTNYPGEYSVRPDEYKTLSFFNRIGNFNDGTMWGPNEGAFWVSVTYYLAGSEVARGIYPLATGFGSSVRNSCTDLTCTFDDTNIITTIGAGPQNFADAGIVPPTHDKYVIDIYSYNNCTNTPPASCTDPDLSYLDDIIYTATFNIDTDCEKFEPVTISFMNQYGAFDYYTFNKRNTRQVTTQRNEYTKTLGNWNTGIFSIDETGRGATVFSSTSDTTMTLSTNWMSDDVSKWMQELYASPYTLGYINGQWEPIVITTNTYEEKTYAREQLFQHEITIKFANNQKIQRG